MSLKVDEQGRFIPQKNTEKSLKNELDSLTLQHQNICDLILTMKISDPSFDTMISTRDNLAVKIIHAKKKVDFHKKGVCVYGVVCEKIMPRGFND
jgi:hypothetical protein